MKIFRSYKNLLAATVFFASVVGVAALMLIDGENNLRSPFLNNNFLSRFIEKVGIERIDFSAKGFACFCITYLDVLALFFAMLYSRTLGLYFRIQNRKFNLRLYYFVIILLFTVVFVGSLFFLGMEPYDFLELSIIYAFFFVFFIIAAAAFFLVCTLIAFIHSRIVKEKFSFPVDDELTDLDEVETETPKRSIFPSLTEIDKKYADAKPVKLPACNVLSLKDLTEGFRQYAYSKYSINYNISSVRAFVSGMAMSRLVFLRGEGEAPLQFVRIFTEYLSGVQSVIPVQKEWDSESDVLGYYSEREGQFMCSSFVEKLYEAAYMPERVNLISFTDMGAAEIYENFGAVLNTLYRNALNPQLNLLRVKKGQYNGKLPQKLSDGSVAVGKNTWILGILGDSERESEIAKKVAEDFVVVSIMRTRAKISVPRRCKCLLMHADELNDMFDFADSAAKFKLTVPELEKFLSVADYVYDSFNIRIDGVTIDYVQIFVSCYVYCGGTKEEALDIVFVKKIFCKLKGREGDYIATGLSRLDEKIVNLYGKSAFRYTRAEIKKEIEKMEKAKKKGMDA